jgi:RNA 2',3'-cyclic 3'-phosphodiesterase
MYQPHYFIAVPIPESLKREIGSWAKENKGKFLFRTWVHEEDYHITLAFLGAVNESQFSFIDKKMKQVVLQHKAFQLQLDKLGTFGLPERPRVFWAGIKKSENLMTLQSNVFNKMRELKFTLEQRRYSPHLTIARKWDSDSELDVMILNQSQYITGLSWNVTEIVLYESNIKSLPKYKKKMAWSLM